MGETRFSIDPQKRKQLFDELLAVRRVDHADRTIERGAYTIDRTGYDFIARMGGIEYFFEYVRNLGKNNILDIGSGTTKAIGEIARSSLARGLNIEATVLSYHDSIDSNLGIDNVHISSAEDLRGSETKPILDGAYGGVLALNSVGYSHHPDLVVRQIDRVLAPGGVFKGVFAAEGMERKYLDALLRDPEAFISEFRHYNYDLSYFPQNPNRPDWGNSIVVAIKPLSGDRISTARELLEADNEFFDFQLTKWKREHSS